METIGRIRGIFWALCVGVVALYAFFAALDAFSPTEAVWVTATVAALAVLCAVHFTRIRHSLGKHAHDVDRRALNAFRERRGF